MQSALNKLRGGQLSFASFAKETHSDWDRLACKLLARWKAPSAVDTEDLVQEMLLEAWVAVEKYDEARGALKPFVIWRAMTAAKRWLNVQRGVSSHNGDKAKSRFDKPSGDMFGEADIIPSVEASQERIVAFLQRLQAAARMMYVDQYQEQCDDNIVFDADEVIQYILAHGECNFGNAFKLLQQTAIQLEE